MNKFMKILSGIGGAFKNFFVSIGEGIVAVRDKCNPKVLRISVFAGGGALALGIGLIVWFSVIGGDAVVTATKDAIVTEALPDAENVPDGESEDDSDIGTGPRHIPGIGDVDENGVLIAGTPESTVASGTPASTTRNNNQSSNNSNSNGGDSQTGSDPSIGNEGQETPTTPPADAEPFVRIVLSDTLATSTVSASGATALIEGSRVEINQPGDYLVTGSTTTGNIVVSAAGNVNITLSNASITRGDGPPLRATRDMEPYVLTLINEGTNVLRDARPYVPPAEIDDIAEADPNVDLPANRNGAIYCHAGTLVITGGGTLEVHGSEAHGINARNNLSIDGANLVVTAPRHGIRSRLEMFIRNNSNVRIDTIMKGIRGAGTKHGTVNILDSNVTINSGRDGIHADMNITIERSVMNITAGGGYISGNEDILTKRGLRAVGQIRIEGGTHNYNCAEDGIFATGFKEKYDADGNPNAVFIKGADITIMSNRRAIRGKWGIEIWDSNINIPISNYGMRGLEIFLYDSLTGGNGGTTRIHVIADASETGATNDFDQPEAVYGTKGETNLRDLPSEIVMQMFSLCTPDTCSGAH